LAKEKSNRRRTRCHRFSDEESSQSEGQYGNNHSGWFETVSYRWCCGHEFFRFREPECTVTTVSGSDNPIQKMKSQYILVVRLCEFNTRPIFQQNKSLEL
jgi:hypothetical protein